MIIMSHSPQPPHSPLPENASQELKDEFNSIIEQLRNATGIDAETLMTMLLKKILERLSKQHGTNFSYGALTSKQQKELEAELDKIAQALEESGALGDEKNMIGMLKKMLGLGFSDKKQQLDEFESMENAQKKEYTRLLKLFIIYEIYKITNPHQLAGETELDNFINNTLTRGTEFAKKFASKDEYALEQLIKQAAESLSPSKLKQLDQKGDHSFTNALAQHKNKDPGWER